MENKQFTDILKTVPGSFKAKLERIRRFLYLGKVSIMVGAGFSRNADVAPNIKVKQWNDVGRDIYCRLQGVDNTTSFDLEFKTPMRLASQYAAVNGRSELDNLIRDSIPDDRMTPGELHRQLLDLPWRDVFTTNYDTLLERARNGLHRNYSVVTSKEMLLYKKSPRIIKLHGSFPDKTPFLMTEEDFISYPTEHPEFVNTVRQALVESVFCLVGFSGDDPNFTSWQAWLQDVMGDYAGPSYLITCDKNYDESFKVLMGQRGVDVLNFAECPRLEDYRTALNFFFTYLAKREPEWNGSVGFIPSDANAKKIVNQLREVRESYPGWFILPQKYYIHFHDMATNFPSLETSFKELEDEEDREEFLFELDWRANISLSFKDYEWYRQGIEQIVNSYGDNPLSEKALSLAISLLRLYRHHLDKRSESDALQKRVHRELSRMTAQQRDMYFYIVACNALSWLDYDVVEKVLGEWTPSPSHYAGIIYKALVVSESDNRTESIRMLSEALESITLSLSQTTTQEELSLRSVISDLLAFYSGEQMPECNTGLSFSELSNCFLLEMRKENNEDYEETYGFAIGSRQRSWHIRSGVNTELFNPYRYLLLFEVYGFPYGMTAFTVDETNLQYVLEKLANFNIGYSLGIVLRSGSQKLTRSFFSRRTLKEISRTDADTLARMLLRGSSSKTYEKARRFREENVLLPLLSRLTSICSMETAVEIFKFVHRTFRVSNRNVFEDMQFIYRCLMPEAIQDVYGDAFDSDILCNRFDQDIPIPHTGLSQYKPSGKAVDVVCDGLLSTNDDIRNFAYYRAQMLLKSNICDDRRESLVSAIKRWRNTMPIDNDIRHSYTIVAPDEEEVAKMKEQILKDLKDFSEGDYKYKRSSSTISSFADGIRRMELDGKYFTKEQNSIILNKISDVLETNFEFYSVDDSGLAFGGFRKFTEDVFKRIHEYVRIVTFYGHIEKTSCEKLLKIHLKYLPSKLPVRFTIERLNTVAQVLGANKLRDLIVHDIISDNEDIVRDSCDGLLSYIYHYNGFQKVLQDIIFHTTHGSVEFLQHYLEILKYIPFEKMTRNTKEQIALMLKVLLERIQKLDIIEEQKNEIMYEGFSLAKSLKIATSPLSLVEAVKQWEEYANEDRVFNDVKRPWFVD